MDKYKYYEVNGKIFYSYDEAFQEYLNPDSRRVWGFHLQRGWEVILEADNEQNT